MGISLLKDANAKFGIEKQFTATGDIAASGASPFNVRAENQLRVVVENVGGGNVIRVRGKIAKQTAWTNLATITGATSGTTVDISLVDELYFDCTTYAASGGTPKLVAAGFFEKASSGGGGSGEANTASNQGTGGIGLFDGKVGVDLQFKNIAAGSAKVTVVDDVPNKLVSVDVDPAQIAITDLDGIQLLTSNTVVGVDNAGDVVSLPGWNINTATGGLNQNLTYQNDDLGGNTFHALNFELDPLQNSPDDSMNGLSIQATIDPNSTGFTLGTNGNIASIVNIGATHQGTSDIGGINGVNQYYNMGNGTDAINSKGILYYSAFTNVNANVTLNGPMQGYIFQPTFNASSAVTSGHYITAFGDFTNIPIDALGYTSMGIGPTIGAIQTGNGYSGINLNTNITTLQGNAGFTGVGIYPTIGTLNSGYMAGFNFNPTVTLNKGNIQGIAVNVVDNVTNYAGVQASKVVQDLTFTFNEAGSYNNSYTIEFVDDTTAGNESVTIAGLAITVHMESGVSTATQIKAAADATLGFGSTVTTTISGVGSNAQVAAGPVSFAGGIDPGSAKAAYFKGDVQIDGALQFSGALNIGKLTSYASQALVSGTGTPASIDQLVTNPTVAANATLTAADLLGINTAMLLNVGANASVSTAFLGVQALGLPAVVTMGAGSTVDLIGGAAFAISLDAGAGGGTISNVHLCSSLAIPNGTTTVTNTVGYWFDMPFGDVGTNIWGVYSKPTSAQNYFAGAVKVCGTDTVANASVALEVESTTKAVVLSRMSTVQKNALTAIAGMMVFDTTLSQLSYYDGGAWVNL